MSFESGSLRNSLLIAGEHGELGISGTYCGRDDPRATAWIPRADVCCQEGVVQWRAVVPSITIVANF